MTRRMHVWFGLNCVLTVRTACPPNFAVKNYYGVRTRVNLLRQVTVACTNCVSPVSLRPFVNAKPYKLIRTNSVTKCVLIFSTMQ